jgi:hypothetical protein
MKLKRRKVESRYAAEIEAMYENMEYCGPPNPRR